MAAHPRNVTDLAASLNLSYRVTALADLVVNAMRLPGAQKAVG